MAYTNFTGKNVLFLQGSQDNLNNLIKNGEAIEGAFYLTQDTHRLYVGRKNDEGKIFPVAVNEGVVTVDKVESLPSSGINAGEFYYATNENILCVYNGSNFVQINSNTDTKNKELAITITQPKIGETEEKENKANIEVKVKDDVGDSVYNSYTITDTSGRNVITVSEKVIDIKGDAYSLNAVSGDEKTATINLASENTSNDTSINLKAGDNVNLSVDDKNNITINSSFTDTIIKSGVTTLNADGSISVTLTDNFNNDIEVTASSPITYSIGNAQYIPGSILPVYTQTQIDEKLKDLNGLTYKGTVGTTALPTSEVEAGWMYLVDALIEIEESKSATGKTIYATAGDLLVASGEDEDDNGYLTTIQWTYIPSGDDIQTDTQYVWTSEAASNKKTLQEINSGEDVIGSWAFTGGTAIEVSSEDTNEALVTTIKHANVTCTPSTGDEKTEASEITAVTAIEVNGQGHVTKVETTKHTIKDTTYTLSGATVSANGNGVKIIDTLTDSANGKSNSELTVTSDTLKLTAGTGSYNIDITWGSF